MAQAPVAPPQIENQPPPGQWTYEDYLNLPEDGRRYEIIDGVLYVTNAPDYQHQYAGGEIFALFREFVRTHHLGHVLKAPFKVHLSDQSRPVLPDVLFVRAERWNPVGEGFFEGAPDLVVEVLSPDTYRTDYFVKFLAYEQAGVAEYWIANPKARTLQVHTLSGGEYALAGEFAGDEVIRSVVLEGLAIVTSTLFNPVYQ